jgi:hypothetical protein
VLFAFAPHALGGCNSSPGADELARHLASTNLGTVICGKHVGLDSRFAVRDFQFTPGDPGSGSATVEVQPTKAAGWPAPGTCVGRITFRTAKIALQSRRSGVVGHDERISSVTVVDRGGLARVEPRVPLPPHPRGYSYEGFAGSLSETEEIHGALVWGDVELADGRRADDFFLIRNDEAEVVLELTPGPSGDHPATTTQLVLALYTRTPEDYDRLTLVKRAVAAGNAPATLAFRGPGTFTAIVTSDGSGFRQGAYRLRMQLR